MTLAAALVNTFILAYLCLAWCWGQPSDSWLGRAIALFSRVVLWLGLGQTWGMFAPDPAMVEGHLGVVVVLEDGRTIQWSTPRMDELSYADAFMKFRHQKYEASVLDTDTAYLRPALAEHLLRLHANRHPVRVDFVYLERAVPPPGEHPQMERPLSQQVFFTFPE